MALCLLPKPKPKTKKGKKSRDKSTASFMQRKHEKTRNNTMPLLMLPKPKPKKTPAFVRRVRTKCKLRVPKYLAYVMNVIEWQDEPNGSTEEQIIAQFKQILQEKNEKCRNVTMEVRKSIQCALVEKFLKDHGGRYSLNGKKYAKYNKLNDLDDYDPDSDLEDNEMVGKPGGSSSKRSNARTSQQRQQGCRKRKSIWTSQQECNCNIPQPNQFFLSRSSSDDSNNKWQNKSLEERPRNQLRGFRRAKSV